jgi:phosphopantothenate---cysteine ligase (CTP)
VENLAGKNIMITSGPIRGYIDDVRYISNKSTGRLGALLATEAMKRGASVTFMYGMGSCVPDCTLPGESNFDHLTLIEIETFHDLHVTIKEKINAKPFDVIIHAMAVLDYIPEKHTSGKIASNKDKLTVTLVKTPKVIKLLRTLWPHALLIGFKLEAGVSQDELIERAYASLKENHADFVVANNQDEIVGEKHRSYVINAQKEIKAQCETKYDVAVKLMDVLSRYWNVKVTN